MNLALDHRITGGSEYMWECYPDARHMDYESEFAHGAVVFNTLTQEIYTAEVSLKEEAWEEDHRPYRWQNPDYKDDYYSEALVRNVDPDQAWDDVKWIDVDIEEDFLEKAEAIFNGEEWDTGIQVQLDLSTDEIYQLMMKAHEKNITLNQYVAEILQLAIDKHEHCTGSMDGYELGLG